MVFETYPNGEKVLPQCARRFARKAKTAAFILYKTFNATILDQTPMREISRFHGLNIVAMEGFMRQRQYRWFESVFRDHEINHVGETGFNGGHSAFTFANLGAEKVVSFDLGEHHYVQPAAKFLERRFPNTDFELLLGDSRQTLPRYIASAAFDLVFIDGDHSLEGATEDINNMYDLSSKNGLVVVDDYYPKNPCLSGAGIAYDIAVRDGMIDPIEVKSGDLRTWAFGKYNK